MIAAPSNCTRETRECIDMSLGRDAIDGLVLARALLCSEGKFDGPVQALVRSDALGGSVLDTRVRLNSSNVQRPALAHWAIP